MRDGASGRSRGFGFLTFKDARTVNIVMVKEHYLDGKIVRPDLQTHLNTLRQYPSKSPNPTQHKSSQIHKIDPKRAIPRDEQERTSKIFVGGVSQEATEQDFKEYFMQFGRVVDATLMMDKDTGRPRGFGFVTFDSEAAVDACLASPLEILGKPIEVKKAQPRGNMREEEESRGGRGGRFRKGGADENQNSNQQQQGGGNQMAPGGMTPQLMAQYWQRMQQYFAMMQQQMAMGAGRGMVGGMPGGMNPAMMAQMAQMQQMQQMQQQMQGGAGGGSQSPQSPGAGMAGMQGMQGMNPQMMQQMQAMQMQGMGGGGGGGMGGGYTAGGGSNPGGRIGTPGYNAYEQQVFEQQKYEQQQMRRAARDQSQYAQPGYGMGGGPTSWEGMYDDVPQPNVGGNGGGGRGNFQGGRGGGGSQRGSVPPQTGPQSAPPANAPTGPKNAGKPGANYRGGGRGGQRGFHPYAR